MSKKSIIFILAVVCIISIGFFGFQIINTSKITKSMEEDWQAGELTFIPGYKRSETKEGSEAESVQIEEELRAEYGDLVPDEMFADNDYNDSLLALLMTKTSVKVKVKGLFVKKPLSVKVLVQGPDMPEILDKIFSSNPEINAEQLRTEIENCLAAGDFPQREREVDAELHRDENGEYVPDHSEELLDALYGDSLSYYRDALLEEVPEALGLTEEGGAQ